MKSWHFAWIFQRKTGGRKGWRFAWNEILEELLVRQSPADLFSVVRADFFLKVELSTKG
jgi:hypothetical protein